MAKKSKQSQSVQRQDNEYLIARDLRVQENNRKMQELGLKTIANSLTSLTGSQKMKNKKVKPTYHNARDEDYNPGYSDDNEEEYSEVNTNVEASKKQHRPRYIAPMSLNKIAKLAKQHRVIAPKVSDSNTMKANHSKATLSMGELISSNKGTKQRAFTQNLEKPACIKHGLKKRLVLVDENDDEDDEVSQDMESAGLEDNGNEWYNLRSQDQDDEYDDMDLTESTNNDDEIQEDDSHDDLEGEDNALVQDQLHRPELEKNNRFEISKTNKRGPTMLHLVHTRKVNEREVIICNEFGQPVGPATKEKDIVGKFSRFLGTIARNHSYAPLTYSSWHKVPHKDKIWEYVLVRF
ncbi:hypothetical protein HanXRQr2_Chr09g0365291 [Helianthus annuus]|uniref:Uncharacterized protein n=1 Tax=Helianthus annuus TaxID=4232 RepID=A0A9K3N6Q0_HELAN|nr:hypothetical protein HanXRQr2_Chr09g0365291 [Helianthus annuus]